MRPSLQPRRARPDQSVGPAPSIQPLEPRQLLTTFAHINFAQPASAPYPGYLADVGLAYDNRGNGFAYGWLTAPAGVPVPTDDPATRDRGSPNAPDKRFDTFDHFHKIGQSFVDESNKVTDPTWWQISLPNGAYQIRVVGGDPDNTDETLALYAQADRTANGVPIVNDPNTNPGFHGMLLFSKVAAIGDNFADSGLVNVLVTDGTLTISEAANAVNDKINFIDIDSVPEPSTALALALGAVIVGSRRDHRAKWVHARQGALNRRRAGGCAHHFAANRILRI
jgi:hypothetical protein